MNMIVYSFRVEIQLRRLFRALKNTHFLQLPAAINFTLVIKELRHTSLCHYIYFAKVKYNIMGGALTLQPLSEPRKMGLKKWLPWLPTIVLYKINKFITIIL